MIVFGTRVIGKKNKKERYKTCTNCGKFSNLESYDARKWFTLYFIPIFPVSSFHIEDLCPKCKYGFQSKKKDWETSRLASLTLLENPDISTPDNAINSHVIADKFGTKEQALSVARKIEKEYADSLALLEYLAKWKFAVNQFDEAIPTLKMLSDNGVYRIHDLLGRYYLSKNELEIASSYLLHPDFIPTRSLFPLYQKLITKHEQSQILAEAYKVYLFLNHHVEIKKMLNTRKVKRHISKLEDKLGLQERIVL